MSGPAGTSDGAGPEIVEAEIVVAEAVVVREATAPEAGPAQGEALLRARSVTKRFGGLVAVRDVNLDIPPRAIVSIIGPNGAGKTTFFNVVAGILDPTSGSVEFAGRTMVARPRRTWLEPILWMLPAVLVLVVAFLLGVQSRTEAEVLVTAAVALGTLVFTLLLAIVRPSWYQTLLARYLGVLRSARPNDMVAAGIGRTFQNIRLFQNMTALENVLVGMHLKLRSNLIDHLLSTRRQRQEEDVAARRASELLRLVGLRGRENEVARNLPYGDQRRLELARALGNDPALLLLDEPTAGMNPAETAQMTQLIGRLRRDLGVSVLLIEHDMRVVMGISDHILVMDHGERISEGTPDHVRRDPKVIEAYLGAAPT
ncbi:MAG: branched-chain amino acid transport system ATP-binding protein [Chloroflexota bacterium]|jgi:ABC-type branched-subunit amino acid transport system ATPase component|nr:branched-chain amino acid transport system ATP-binding protein [Chloroflexota bacterium]